MFFNYTLLLINIPFVILVDLYPVVDMHRLVGHGLHSTVNYIVYGKDLAFNLPGSTAI